MEENNKSENDLIANGHKEIKIIHNLNKDIEADLAFKIIVIGNSSVGKSSLVDRATKNRFKEDYSATIGFDFCSFCVSIDKKIIKLQIWDTCGQEIYQSLITNFYRNSSLALLVYSINNRNSFENLEIWLKELRKESNPNVKTILIANKCDLESDRKVTYEEAEKYSKDFNFYQFFETSAKTGFNAQKIFINSAILLYDDYMKFKKEGTVNEQDDITSTQLTRKKNKKEKKGCC